MAPSEAPLAAELGELAGADSGLGHLGRPGQPRPLRQLQTAMVLLPASLQAKPPQRVLMRVEVRRTLEPSYRSDRVYSAGMYDCDRAYFTMAAAVGGVCTKE